MGPTPYSGTAALTGMNGPAARCVCLARAHGSQDPWGAGLGFGPMRPNGAHALLLLALVGCTSDTGGEPSSSVTARSSTTPSPSAVSASAEPSATSPEVDRGTVFGRGTISSDEEEYRISFTPDGQTAYFARGGGFFPQSRQATILETTLVDGAWTEPVVASFSGEFPDIDPWVSPDGNSIYFSSIRPLEGQPRTDADLWRVDRDGDGWGEPVHLHALSSERDELGPSVSEDGAIWFASDRPGGTGGWDLYTAKPAGGDFTAPEPVLALNSAVWEFNPAISPDGTTLLFTSINRPGGSGLGDLFRATLADGAWDVQPLPMNTSADEYHPSLSPDGATLYFVRRAGNGDLYEVPFE